MKPQILFKIDDIVARAPRIEIEVTIADLIEEQKAKFGDYIKFWDSASNTLYTEANSAGVTKAMSRKQYE